MINKRNPIGKLREMIAEIQQELLVPKKINLTAICMYHYLANEYGTILVKLGYLKILPGGKGTGRGFKYEWAEKKISEDDLREMVKIYNTKRNHDRVNVGSYYTRVSLRQVLNSHTK